MSKNKAIKLSLRQFECFSQQSEEKCIENQRMKDLKQQLFDMIFQNLLKVTNTKSIHKKSPLMTERDFF